MITDIRPKSTYSNVVFYVVFYLSFDGWMEAGSVSESTLNPESKVKRRWLHVMDLANLARRDAQHSGGRIQPVWKYN